MLQSSPDVFPWASLGVGGIMAGIIFFYYRADRKQVELTLTEALRKSDERWQSLAADFRTIIQDNTRAITSLEAAMRSTQCPLAGQHPANIIAVPKPKLAAGS